MQPGEFATIAGANGHIVVELDKVISADPAAHPEDVAKLRDALSVNMQNDVLDQLIASFKSDYGVTVNQSLLDDVLASY